ncbi:MAG: hypothetical protein JWL83_4643 [Actinomycetia bacterium]|nr:hypothetical protein [Actinomycetes bacterium]
MRRGWLAILSALLGVTALGTMHSGALATDVVHAPRIPASPSAGRAATNQWSASNWSGYAVTGSGLSSVSGTFRVPAVTGKTRGRPSYSSSWVGIDGFNNQQLIQAGTAQDWSPSTGTAHYYAWWEILPAAETPIPSSAITVHAGDMMKVSINRGTTKWTIAVTNTTTGKTFSTQQNYSGPGASAEWIVEAPSIGGRTVKLANYGSTVFDSGTVNGASPNLAIADSGYMKKGKRHISTPSAPDNDPQPDGFAIQYGAVAPPPPAS